MPNLISRNLKREQEAKTMELPNTNTKITQNWNPKQIQINLTQSQIRNTNKTQEKNTQYEIDTNNKEHNEIDFF